MRILHYFLGFPPYRTGGLTKYALDLMREQVGDKNDVMALWPGRIGIVDKRVRIRREMTVEGITSYELINPLPVSLDEGIRCVDAYMKKCCMQVYGDFLSKQKPDVIHIHTLMGVHREFIDAAVKLGIRTVFTTHDYFGICPRVTLFQGDHVCEDDHDCKDCVRCNSRALSLKKIAVMQSSIYRKVKNNVFMRMLRKRHRSRFFSEETMPQASEDVLMCDADEYLRLRSYYIGMLERMDVIHFNSSVAEFVYKRYFTPKFSRVVTITHRNVKDRRKDNVWQYNKVLRITCLAPAKPFKGFTVLKDVLDELWREGYREFELKMYSTVNERAPYMRIYENGFQDGQLCSIMAETDVLIAPSIWYETFGFTVLEAVSCGVPVIISNHVGAKDIIGQGGIVVEAGNREELKQAILSLTKERQNELRSAVLESAFVKPWRTLVDETYQLYTGEEMQCFM
ncbi:MAG: glycosyltransferase [bacterium]|nr:glycosyltransferase [bacterium]MCM1499440.1 glycosyltransferase [Clostridium sp.]